MSENNNEVSGDDEDDIVVRLSAEESAEFMKGLKENFGVVNSSTGKMSSGQTKEEFEKLSPKRQRMLRRALQGLPPIEHLEPGE